MQGNHNHRQGKGIQIWLVLLLLVSTTAVLANPLVVINSSGTTVSAAPYLSSIILPNSKNMAALLQKKAAQLKGRDIPLQPLLYPNHSEFSAGKVMAHQLLHQKHASPLPLFVIGTDARSIAWATQNATVLKKLHAVGIITNVDTAAQTADIEARTGLTLMPARLEGMTQLLATRHYPFLLYHGWVTQ